MGGGVQKYAIASGDHKHIRIFDKINILYFVTLDGRKTVKIAGMIVS